MFNLVEDGVSPTFIWNSAYLISPHLFNILWTLILLHIFSLLKFFHFWPLEVLSVGSSIYLTYPHHCVHVCVFIKLWCYKMVQSCLAYFLPKSQNQPFLQGTLVPLVCTKNQDLGVKCTPYHLDIIASRPFQLIKKIYMHLFLSLSLSLSIYIYMYIYTSLYVLKYIQRKFCL